METNSDVTARKMKAAFTVGLIGGLFWNLLGYAAYFMNFTTIGPSIFVKPFIAEEYVDQPWAHLSGLGAASLLSIVLSIFYVFTLSKFYQPWIGILYGLGLFAMTFYILNPLLNLTKQPFHHMGMNTFSTEICLFILYGLFIGISLSSEFSNAK